VQIQNYYIMSLEIICIAGLNRRAGYTTGFRICKNLRDHLGRSKLPKEKDMVRGMFKCGNRPCKICDNVLVGSSWFI
jgi:hypothetical protein